MIPGLLNPWLILGFVGALGVAGVSGYLKGAGDERAKCNTAALEATIAAKQADLDISASIAATAQEQAKRSGERAAADQAIIEEMRHALQNDPCSLSPDDVERLRRIGAPAR